MVSAAVQAAARPELAVRSLSAQLVAPLPVGRATLHVEELRAGRGTAAHSVRVFDVDEVLLAHGVVVLGAPRAPGALPDGHLLEPPAEVWNGPEAVPVVPLGPPLAPHFLRHLELRPIAGLPYTGDSECTGWVRPLAPVDRCDAPLLVALADAWWVAAMAQLAGPRSVGTLTSTVDLPIDAATLPVGAEGLLEPLFHRGRTLAAREGYAIETRELWTRDGRLASWNTQTVAIIR
jgi:hypothetical protein